MFLPFPLSFLFYFGLENKSRSKKKFKNEGEENKGIKEKEIKKLKERK